jgi:predicted Fe-Mo cluster-binding NifX family protein
MENNMKISISTDGENVSQHFGRCPEFTIAEIQGGKLIKVEKAPNPGHSPGAIPEYLHGKGVNRIICGGIGARATGLFSEYGIQVIAGISGDINSVLDSFLDGTLIANSDNLCTPGAGRGYGLDKTVCDHAD